MAEVEKYRIPLLDGTNYSDWKFRIETLLAEIDLSIYIEADYTSLVVIADSDDTATKTRKEGEITEHKKRDQKCKSQIIQRIADSHLEYAKDKASAYEIWLSLENAFQRKGIASQLLLRKALLTMKFDTVNDSLANHFLKFDKLIRQLKSTGATLEESDVVCHLLLTMPAEYNTVVTALETMSTELLTLNFVKTRLLDEESKRNEGTSKRNKHNNTSSTAFSSASKGTFKGTKNKTKFSYNCHNCGLPGHKRIDCRKKPQKNKVNENSTAQVASDNQEVYSFIANERGDSKTTSHWYLDSGATEHLASDDIPLVNLEKLSKPITINVAKSGIYMQANQVGELNVTNTVNGKTNQIIIRGVLLVKNLTYNLLSVRKLETNGFKVLFTGRKGIISKGNKVIAIATINNSQLYELNFDQTKITKAFASTVTDLEIWHKRFGHLNYESIKKILSQDKEHKVNLSKNVEKCWTCVEGKQTKLPHNQHRIRAKRPLQLIHSDLIGPINPVSYDKKKYVLTFVDDYTHFAAAYIIESKTEVLKFFKKYEAMATAHFNSKVSRFRCDNGREYISNEIVKYFEEKGIQFEFTIRYTPEQNGVAERMNRTILERARCMILGCNLGKAFWSEAVLAAVYLINRSPTSALNGDAPARKWFNEPIKLLKLKVFGCIAYLHMPKELITGKFESRSKKCYFIGYCPNGYKLWCPQERKILYGKDVIFNEEKFSFNDSISENWIPQFNNSTDPEPDNSTVNEIEEDKAADSEEDSSQTEKNNSRDMNIETEKATLRKSDRKRNRPKYLEDYAVLALHAESFVEDAPNSFEEIQDRDDKEEWIHAVQEEVSALEENDTWEVVDLPQGKRAISCRWIFKIKRDSKGEIERYKARLVIRGNEQKQGFDYEETYAPVARLTTFRTLLAIINERNLHAFQLDVKNAFLHGRIKEEIYMKLPLGFTNQENKVCKLKKALYGLKQAPRAWNETFDKAMKELKFRQSEVDKCLYIWKSNQAEMYLLLYVDDIIIAGNDCKRITETKKKLMDQFRMKDFGNLHSFLGVNIHRTKDEIKLSQPNSSPQETSKTFWNGRMSTSQDTDGTQVGPT